MLSMQIRFLLIIIACVSCTEVVVGQSSGKWSKALLDDSIHYGRLSFCDASHGFACSVTAGFNQDRFYTTRDGGITWERVSLRGLDTVPTTNSYVQFSYPSPQCLYISEDSPGPFVATYDSGMSWEKRQSSTQTFGYEMWSASSGIRINLLSYVVERTTDSAKTYSSFDPGNIFKYNYLPAGNLGANDSTHWTVLTTVDTGVVALITSNAGRTWRLSKTLTPGYTSQSAIGTLIPVWGTSNLWMNPVSSYDPILFSSDYGVTWAELPSLKKQDTRLFAPIDSNTYWLVAIGSDSLCDWLYFTSDRGVHWKIDSVTLKGCRALQIFFTDASHGWVLADTLKADDINYPYKEFVFRYSPDSRGVEKSAEHVVPIRTYPSPAREFLMIESSDNVEGSEATIEIFDVLGRSQRFKIEERTSRTMKLDVREMSNGYYIARIGANNVSFVKMQE
jgi:photosystem II stability/assembly factor-like uncharacterized protein